MGDKPVKPESGSASDPKPVGPVPWYKYKYSILDWVVFAFFAAILFLIARSCWSG
jgi:hypothetical protein